MLKSIDYLEQLYTIVFEHDLPNTKDITRRKKKIGYRYFFNVIFELQQQEPIFQIEQTHK